MGCNTSWLKRAQNNRQRLRAISLPKNRVWIELLVNVRSDFSEFGLLPAHELARVGQIEQVHVHTWFHRWFLPHFERFRAFPQLQLLQNKTEKKKEKEKSINQFKLKIQSGQQHSDRWMTIEPPVGIIHQVAVAKHRVVTPTNIAIGGRIVMKSSSRLAQEPLSGYLRFSWKVKVDECRK